MSDLIPSIAPKPSSVAATDADSSSFFTSKTVLLGIAGVAVVGLAGLVMLNYRDAMLGKNVKSVVKSSLEAQGATYAKGAFTGGPIKPGVAIPEAEAVSGILGTFVQFMNNNNNGSSQQQSGDEAGAPNEYDEVSKYNKQGGMSLGMPDDDEVLPVDADRREQQQQTGGNRRARKGSGAPVGVARGDIDEESSFATFSTAGSKSRSFDPQALLKRYERASAAAGGPDMDEDDDEDGDASSDSNEHTYVDMAAKKLGKCPKFPEEPINTNIHGSESNSYTDGSRPTSSSHGRRQKRVRFAGDANRGINTGDHPGTSVHAPRRSARSGGSGGGRRAPAQSRDNDAVGDREQQFLKEMSDVASPSGGDNEYNFDENISVTYNPNTI